ncbi:hypothetical protein IAR50_005243 [Cryptococcus sp. DSM 104548]
MPPVAIRFLVPLPGGDGRSAHRPHPYIVLDKPSPSSLSLPTPPVSERDDSSRRSSSTTIPDAHAPITPASLSASQPSGVPPMSSQSRKRKASYVRPSPGDQLGAGKKAKVEVRMKPNFETILARCAAYDPSDDGHTVKPTHSSSTKTYLHPYSPASDWGNFRSSNLSRAEEVREERMQKAKKMGKEEKRVKMEKLMRVKELVKEMKVTMSGGVYVAPPVEEMVVEPTPEGTPRPATARSARGKKSLSPASISTRAKSHSPLATETPLVADVLADPPKTVPLAAGKVKPGRPKKVTVVEAKERPSRSSGRTKEVERS